MNNFAKAWGDCSQEFPEIEMRGHRVINFEQQLRMVAIPRRSPLSGAYAFKINRIVNGDRNLPGHLRQKLQIVIAPDHVLHARESQGAQTSACRSERERAVRLHVVL